jgi:glucose/arabinose dehydrogenase/mono/diheme cytochrome c family protein
MKHCVYLCIFLFFAFSLSAAEKLVLEKGMSVTLLGGGLGSRMENYGHFETEVQRRHAGKLIVFRNMCDDGNTPGFRPHSARKSPFAFPDAKKYYPLSKARDRWGSGHSGHGFNKTPDQWLTHLKSDAIIAFFGYSESFRGTDGLVSFKAELADFIKHTLSQKYNGESAPKLILVSPTAFQNLSKIYGTPDGIKENVNLEMYTLAMKEVAVAHKIPFVDLYSTTKALFAVNKVPLTRDGAILTDSGYALLAPILATKLFGKQTTKGDAKKVLASVLKKCWLWTNYYKIPNGVHVYGRRHGPHGPRNYPAELKKLDEMVHVRDQLVWATLAGQPFDTDAADKKTSPLSKLGNPKPRQYLSAKESMATIKIAMGYKIDLFASEETFKNLANPVQMSFDNKGRLLIATMPSYPHYEPGAAKPTDKLIILEDTNGDGKADKETVFAGDLHLPMGFEFAPEGVYVAQSSNLILLRDINGDDKADVKEVILSGFDDHDTHHAISGFCADPSGAILMGEGTFLHSNVETAYGTIRSSNGGFFRYSPQRRHLERTCRLSIPNPWGIAYDDWGQNFFLDTSDANFRWMMVGSVNFKYGDFSRNPDNLLSSQRVRPTAGLEFISSRHFPDEVQGDVLLNNCIGFQGTKQHQMIENGTGFTTKFRHDLLKASDRNFRPVDIEFAPDGSLYLVDWHNTLIGHMQHNARDPLRDHAHGRIYRITYPSRPLVKVAKVDGASIEALLENLKLPEYRVRYRTRRELRGRDKAKVLKATKKWVAELSKSDKNYEHNLVEALFVGWGLNLVDEDLLKLLLKAKDYRARAAAVKVLRYSGHQIKDQQSILLETAKDEHGRVRIETLVTASWLSKSKALPIVAEVEKHQKDKLLNTTLGEVKKAIAGLPGTSDVKVPTTHLTGKDKVTFLKGAAVYRRDGHCGTCHQEDGNGLPAAYFPPLAGSEWVSGSENLLIKVALHGLQGPIKVKGKDFPGTAPMIPFKFLSDDELAAVLTYVRNSFGNKGSVISPSKVKSIRYKTKKQKTAYTAKDLK